ncbi:hypothetical protein F4809DRAFT_614425 [Biscogniauxia mediterranea]|nr:hypothetical protein F4809DRAFT_614425 [Biscogniauxia mediterranea]
MASPVLNRPALGQIASLGSLYDARTDSFVPISLLKAPLPPGVVETTHKHSTDIKVTKSDNYKEKFDTFGIDGELGASFLAGLVKVEGAGRYLSDKRDSSLTMQSSLHYSITTIDEELNIGASGIKESLALNVLDTDIATHVVTKISWGARCIVTAKRQLGQSEDKSQLFGELETQFGILKMIGLNTNGDIDVHKDAGHEISAGSFEVTVFGDVLANDGMLPTNFADAQQFIRNVPKYVSEANGGKGQPLTYTLIPLSFLALFRLLEIKANITLHQLGADCLQRYVQLFEEVDESLQSLREYVAKLRNHPCSIPPQHLYSTTEILSRSIGNEAMLKSEYAGLLKDVRSGRSGPQELWELLNQFLDGVSSPRKIQCVMIYEEKMELEDFLAREGIHFVGYHSKMLETLLHENHHDDAFVLYFNDHLRHHSETWKETFPVFLEIARDKSRNKIAIIVDCDSQNIALTEPIIVQFRDGRVIVDDVVEQRKVLAANCIMRCHQDALDRSIKHKPIQRRAVKIPCPNTNCDRNLRGNWICAYCQSVIEYGFVDKYLYCDCGAGLYDAWEFKCNDPRHGSRWSQYENSKFQDFLDSLEPFEELNILLLGETGVGKSTWINAFINYLTYESLDDAIRADDLKRIIPCSFQTQVVVDGKFEQRDIKIDSSKSEKDGSKGQSATQQTSVYAVDIGNTRVRLIDTPGIGDTRGLDQDNQNMADILRVLRTYDNLHGILILLKPNAARLTVMFRFCIKQLLTHLHRKAAENIAFGFTNTRGSNYKPGDTFKPLDALLSEYKEVNMGLFANNVYCFDSESFRYLAAKKKGIDMGFYEENRRSWEYSVGECRRLVKHFQNITPHKVRSTINLNETRNTIIRMTEPMAIMAEKIKASIDVNNDDIKSLQNMKLNRKQLEEKLYVQKESLSSCEVDQPRTVCTHPSCVEVRSDFEGRNETTTLYTTVCHRPCYLQNVEKQRKGDSPLRDCSAMFEGICIACGHSWMDHMHIYHDYRPMSYQHCDESVKRDLTQNASDIQLKEEAIRMKETAINEFQIEYHQIQEAAIQFGFFLKRHAITPYNDATVEYVDMLIDQEKIKIQNGGSKNKLENLEKYKAEHIQRVDALKTAMENGDSSRVIDDLGVQQLVKSLYGLPHFGKDLENIVKSQEKAAEATYRERSFNVSAGAHWNRNGQAKPRPRARPHPRSAATSQAVPGSFPGDSPKRTIPLRTRTQPLQPAQPAPLRRSSSWNINPLNWIWGRGQRGPETTRAN